jgi:hypothetical protein
MIKKILSTLLVSSALFVFAATGSMAERPTVAIGYTAAYGGYVASGQENEGAGTPQEITKTEESGEFGYSSLFIELSFADRVTIGASWMIDAVNTAMSERTDSICTAQTRDVVSLQCPLVGNAGTSTVKAEFSDLVTGYVEVNIWNGLYAKYGIMEMDVETKESLHTDSSYPNTTMDGSTYGFGWKGMFDNGVFIKTETLMQDWSDIKLTATGATGTANGNTVEAGLSGAVATISIGKAF